MSGILTSPNRKPGESHTKQVERILDEVVEQPREAGQQGKN